MPSKSKAQARFFAAAAHNPDFAKKAGMSTKTAKEWNKADEKAGTLKKGSKKPERVKEEEILDEELLDEASGVGNFPVPPSSLKLMQKYASSIVLTLAYKSFQQMQQNTDDELDQLVASKILPFLKRFQQKYGAQVLNDASMKRYVNQSIKMPIDHEAIFRELPKSLQNEKVKAIIEKMAVFVTFDANYYNRRAGGHAKKINDRTSEIVLSLRPEYFQFSSTSGTDGITKTMERMDYFLGSLEHEMQHAFQEIVTTQVSSLKDKNLEMKKGYGGMDDAYHASGVEFGPQTKDMINAGILWLDNQKDRNELSGNMNRDIKDAIQYAFKRLAHGQGSVYQALKNYKEDANAKKHMTLIFKGLAKHYQEMDNEEDSELDLEPKDVDGGENRMYHSSTNGPDKDADGNDPMVKIYRAMESTNDLKPYNVEEEREHGTPRDDYANPYNKLASMVYHLSDDSILRFMKYNGKIMLTAWKDRSALSDGNAVNMDIPFDKADIITEYINWFKNFDMTERFINELQHKVDGSEMSIEDIADEFGNWYNSAVKKMGGEPEGKKLNAYIDEGTLYIEFKGLRIPLYMQAGYADGVQIDNAETYDGITRISYKDVEHVMTRLFEIYLESTDRQFNRVFKNLDKTTTPDSLDNVWRYVQESSRAPVEESSMRGFMDLVQDAEIADGIDQANKMTDVNLMNKAKKNKQHTINQLGEEEEYDLQGKPVKPNQKSAPVHAGTSTERDVKLDEMPQRFDAFANQDRDEFVDKSVKMTGKHNMALFAEHEKFDVMIIKNGSGFIALDKQGNQLALLSGHVSSKAVQGVPNVFVENAVAAKSNVKGVVYQMYMDILNAGYSILSDGLHSDDAIKFWTRLLTNHTVYVVGGGEVLARATPEKVHKYWNEDENSPSAELRLLLVK
jgi:hypothetical protein